MNLDFALIWAGLIAFAVIAYVVLDGFDLGVGILFPLMPERAHRDEMMNSVAPVWDGNETWLVLGGGGLFAVFPLAYAIIMPALYAPVIALLLGLVFRGVAFEFRWKTERGTLPVGLGVRRGLDTGRVSRKASRSVRSCRASRLPAALMRAAGGTG